MKNNNNFNWKYYITTLIPSIKSVFVKLPAIYTTIIVVYIITIFNISSNEYLLYGSLGLGIFLKMMFKLSSKTKMSKSLMITMLSDVLVGLGVIIFTGFAIEISVLILTLVYVLYYSFIMTVSYSRLSLTTDSMLKDLQNRHDKTRKKNIKKKKKKK
jgi:hypothetical protein